MSKNKKQPKLNTWYSVENEMKWNTREYWLCNQNPREPQLTQVRSETAAKAQTQVTSNGNGKGGDLTLVTYTNCVEEYCTQVSDDTFLDTDANWQRIRKD